MIVRALAGIRCLIDRYDYDGMLTNPLLDLDALAEQAIVIPVRLEHRLRCNGEPYTDLWAAWYEGDSIYQSHLGADLQGHHGIPGKVLAIILPDSATR